MSPGQSSSGRLVEIGRCVHSLSGSLEAIADGLPEGSVQAVELAGLIDGGLPALVALVMAAIADAGAELPDDRREKSMARGYQSILLLRREGAGEDVSREEWREDPLAFMERQRAAGPHVDGGEQHG
jgi:hypothetical protein